jgi:outer membrane protein OmpA-like peptidoglycan-associated protein
MMIRKTILLGFVLSLVAAPAFAGKASKEENAGVGIGAVIGGVAGGPLGAMIGAAFGAKLGDEFNERNERVDSLSASLSGSRDQVAALERDINALRVEGQARDGELQQARELAKPELLTLLQAGIEMDLLFRTDEHVLSDSTSIKLQQLAASLAVNPDIQIRLDGFADERGAEDYNRNLSELRAEHVRNLLMSAGIAAARIAVSAHGESPATEKNDDNFALQRRVSLTLYMGNTPSFAANPR